MVKFFFIASLVLSGTASAVIAPREYSHLTTMDENSLCLYMRHRYVDHESLRSSPTNVKESLECKLQIWPWFEDDEESQYTLNDPNLVQWQKFPEGALTEVCFDLNRLGPHKKINGIGRSKLRCSPKSQAAAFFIHDQSHPNYSWMKSKAYFVKWKSQQLWSQVRAYISNI